MKISLKDIIILCKVRITFFVAFSTAAGFILAGGKSIVLITELIAGVFILACGSASLNQYQEWKSDLLMERTKRRPIPSGRITPNQALIISILLILIGELILFSTAGVTTLLLGLFAIVWYNFIYTPFKKISSLAIIPGALIGAMSPAIGWAGSGADIFTPNMVPLAFFFFIWQVPHFWLLLLIHDVDYEKAGFPTLTQRFSHDQLKRITFVWIISLAASSMLIPLFGIANHIITSPILFLAGVGLVWQSLSLLNQYIENKKALWSTFIWINIYVLVVTGVLSADKLIILN
jgi:protoheme IX farnesyltransferase